MKNVEVRLDLKAWAARTKQTPQQVSDLLYSLEKQKIVKIIDRNHQLFIRIPRTVELGLFLEDEAAIASETFRLADFA